MTVSGWQLRAALAAGVCAALIMSFVAAPDIGPGTLAGVVMILVAVGSVAAPGSVLPMLFLAGVVVYRLAAGGAAVDASLAVLVVLVPLVHRLAAITSLVPTRATCRWAALRPSVCRFLVAVVPVEVALAVTMLIA